MSHAHFARVEPIVGRSLRATELRVRGNGEALVHLLAASGVARWQLDGPPSGRARLRESLERRHGAALELSIRAPDEGCAPDLELLVGDSRGGSPTPYPRLAVAPPTATHGCRVAIALADEALPPMAVGGPLDARAWCTAAPLVASLARALLLRGTEHRREDLDRLLARGVRRILFDAPEDPFEVWVGERETPWPAPTRPYVPPPLDRPALLVVGLGSLGSVAAKQLVGVVGTMVIADPDIVEPENPVRQAYPVAGIGFSKAQVLGQSLTGMGVSNVVALPHAITDGTQVAGLVNAFGIDGALILTGTDADFEIARVLRALDVRHVVGRCYPRARQWEAILVDGSRGASFGELRGHLRLGPLPPPTPEQRAAYSAEGALEAEPATLVESGWAAAWMARLMEALLAPPGHRPRWLVERLAVGASCLVGGIQVVESDDGPAYAIALPGQIRAWRRTQVTPRAVGAPSPDLARPVGPG